jgi:NADH-quinone oxidoreductase subunit I
MGSPCKLLLNRYNCHSGIAYPGTKGRYLLIMEKCTGCSLCDIACQNIAEAITMVYAYDLFLDVPEELFKEYGDTGSPVSRVSASLDPSANRERRPA